MATLASIAKERVQDVRGLFKLSRKLDASQESLEREIRRILVRKKAYPELDDLARLATMSQDVDDREGDIARYLVQLAKVWG